MNITPNATPVDPAAVNIDQLTWMVGNWASHANQDFVDEHWSASAGGVMLGMFRWLKESRVFCYELLAIEPDAQGPVLRLLHFDRGLNGWEEKGMAIAYPLVHIGENEVAFERGGSFRRTRFIYKSVNKNELLAITEDHKGEDVTRCEFHYTRI